MRVVEDPNKVAWLASAGAKGFEPEDVRKRLAVECVHPLSMCIASAHAPELVALDHNAFANRRQNFVNGCGHLII